MDRFASCGSERVGSRRGSFSLKGSPSSIGSIGCGGTEGRGGARGGAGGVRARFFVGGSPRFLVDSLLLSMMSTCSGENGPSRLVESHLRVEDMSTLADGLQVNLCHSQSFVRVRCKLKSFCVVS